MKLSEEQETVCGVFSRRDKQGFVHCPECPMILDHYRIACLKVVTEEEAREEWEWDGDPYPAIHKGGKDER